MQLYESMGELGYIQNRKEHALEYIKADYPRFAVLSIKRFIYFWAGPPRLAQIWWLAQVKNSLFLASSVLMFWGLGRALRPQPSPSRRRHMERRSGCNQTRIGRWTRRVGSPGSTWI